MLGVFEGIFYIDSLSIGRLESLLHHHAMGDDVHAPLGKVTDFVLCFTDDDFEDRALHPIRLPAQFAPAAYSDAPFHRDQTLRPVPFQPAV